MLQKNSQWFQSLRTLHIFACGWMQFPGKKTVDVFIDAFRNSRSFGHVTEVFLSDVILGRENTLAYVYFLCRVRFDAKDREGENIGFEVIALCKEFFDEKLIFLIVDTGGMNVLGFLSNVPGAMF